MFFRSNNKTLNVEEENPFLLSFSDLMACLLAIFIFVIVVMLMQLEKRKAELQFTKNELIQSLESIQEVQNKVIRSLGFAAWKENNVAYMLEKIRSDLKTQGIDILIAENGTVLRIPEHALHFELGRYDIPTASTEAANSIGGALLSAMQEPEYRSLIDTIFVEGHTDSVPNYRSMGNWGLSTYRAISLWKFWTEPPGKLAELKELRTISSKPGGLTKPLFSVSGYADTRSTHGNIDLKKTERPEDRRIDIRFTIVSSEKNDLEDLHDNLRRMQNKTNSLIEKLKQN